jgi:hypothetical protein
VNAANRRSLAVLGAGALIAAGLYFGLRSDGGSTPPAAPAGSAIAVSLPPRAPATTSPEASRSATPEPAASSRDSGLERLVAAESEQRRAEIVRRCWEPSRAKDPLPARLTFRVRFLFDATGQLTRHKVATPEEPSRVDVAECFDAMNLSIAIAPPRKTVGVEVSLSLP